MIIGAQAASSRPAPRERTPRARQIIDTARALLEAVGSDGLTMRRLADELGIRAPSLYKHVNGRPALELALVEIGLDETGLALHAVVAGSNGHSVSDLLGAYRTMGLANPELYRLITASSFPPPSFFPVSRHGPASRSSWRQASHTWPRRYGPSPTERSSSNLTDGSSTTPTSTGPGAPAPRHSPLLDSPRSANPQREPAQATGPSGSRHATTLTARQVPPNIRHPRLHG